MGAREGQAARRQPPRPLLEQLRLATASAGLLAIAVALSGCAAVSPEVAPTSARSGNGADGGETAIAAATHPGGDGDRTVNNAGQAEARAVAESAVVLYCRPTLDAGTWLAALRPLLTNEAVVAYATVQPSRVPCHRLTGPPATHLGDDATQQISLPTDAGMATVTVQRPGPSSPWRVSRITVSGRR